MTDATPFRARLAFTGHMLRPSEECLRTFGDPARDERWRVGTRRVGRCERCGAVVLADDDHRTLLTGVVHGACAPVERPVITAHR